MTAGQGELLRREADRYGVTLDDRMMGAFDLLADELIRWNRTINLTAIRDLSGIVIKHFVDSLTVAPHLKGVGTLLDVGSGAGFPAIPLAIALPSLSVTSLDSASRKCSFQREMGRRLGLGNLTVVTSRVESYAPGTGRFDAVVSRAFASLTDFVTLTLRFVAPAGILIAMKGPEGEEEIRQGRELLCREGIVVRTVERLELPAGEGKRTVIVLERGTPSF